MRREFLIVNMNYLGDALMTTPGLGALRAAYPDSRIDTVAGAGGAADVLEGHPALDAVIPRARGGSFARVRQLYTLLRARRYTDVVILPPLAVYGLAARLAGTRHRTGRAGRGMDFFLTDRRAVTGTHMADMLLETMPLPSGSASPVSPSLSLGLTEQDRAAATELLESEGIDLSHPFIAVNAGTTRPQKRWPPEHFATMLVQLPGVPAVMIGHGTDEVALASGIVSSSGRTDVRSIAGRTSVKVLAAVLERATALITADSGPMHLASAVGTPSVALFGSTDPAVTGPYDARSHVIYHRLSCSPCGNNPICGGRFDCMRGITPDEVVLATRTFLREGPLHMSIPVEGAPNGC